MKRYENNGFEFIIIVVVGDFRDGVKSQNLQSHPK